MLSTVNELMVRKSMLSAYGERVGDLMTGFVLDAIGFYGNKIYWQILRFPEAWPGEIQLEFSGIREKETEICRGCDLLILKPAEGVAIVRPGDSIVEICVDDLDKEPYFMGLERFGSHKEKEKVKARADVLCKVMRDIRRSLCLFDQWRGSDRMELSRILQGGEHE